MRPSSLWFLWPVTLFTNRLSPLLSFPGCRCWADMSGCAVRRVQIRNLWHAMSDAARRGVCGAVSGSNAEWTHRSRGLHWGLDTHHTAWKTFFVFVSFSQYWINLVSHLLALTQFTLIPTVTNQPPAFFFVSFRFPFGHLKDSKLYSESTSWLFFFFKGFTAEPPGNWRDIHTLKCLSGPCSCQNTKPDVSMPKLLHSRQQNRLLS